MEVAEAEVPARIGRQFVAGHAKLGGRAKGTPNKDRKVTISRILELVDPVEGLAKIATGQPMLLAPAPGEEPMLVYPTTADVRAALTTLCNKVLPDLRAVSVEQNGNAVTVLLNLAPSVTSIVTMPEPQ